MAEERRSIIRNWKWFLSLLLPLVITVLLGVGAAQNRIATLEREHQQHKQELDDYISRPEFQQFERRMEEQHEGINKNIDALRDDLRLNRRSRGSEGEKDNGGN